MAVDRHAYLRRFLLTIHGHPIAPRLCTGAGGLEIAWFDAGEVDLASGEYGSEIAASDGMLAVRATALDRAAASQGTQPRNPFLGERS